MWYERVIEKGMIPDPVMRWAIRRLSKARLQSLCKSTAEEQMKAFEAVCDALNKSSLADLPDKANQQHYGVDSRFYQKVLGSHLKYSCAYWDETTPDLDAAEKRMLDLYLERAQLQDGQSILELGCGWGSLTLHMAQAFPNSTIVTLSNSHSQRAFIEERLQRLGLANVRVITQDINDFALDQQFDRVVSIEMFEHVRNYKQLFANIVAWLKPEGKLFTHIFTHREYPYLFEDRGTWDWMSRYFFSGGVMPSNHLFLYFCHPLKIEKHWLVDGTHYEKTSNAWLQNMDHHSDEVKAIFDDIYGQEAVKFYHYWRIFFMAVAELFGYRNGREWMVNHYLFSKRCY